jgi:hypothetical protein
MLVIDPLQALVHPQTQRKNYPAWIVNPSPTPTSQKLPILVNTSAD